MNLLGEKIVTAQVTENGEVLFDLRYSVTSTYSMSGYVYGVRVEKIISADGGRSRLIETETAPSLTHSSELACKLLGTLATNTVTPCVLYDVLDELISAMDAEGERDDDDGYFEQAEIPKQRIRVLYEPGEACVSC